MSEWKVLIADSLDKSAAEILSKDVQVDDLAGISPEDLLAKIGEYDALIVRSRTKVRKEVFDAATKLKVVGRAGVGVDNIDLAAAQEKGVTVVNSPTATSQSVAELTLGMILALIRKIPQADASMKQGQWNKKQLKGSELGGKTLGVVGFGNIGLNVAKRAAAFGTKILAYDPFLPDEVVKERGGEPVSLEELYAQSDLITMHLPLTPETKNMINGETIAQMKRGVFVICAARGGVIDETALLAALESGQVAGAALDVFTEEPPGLTALVAHPNVVATPHIGAQAKEGGVRAAQDIASEIVRVLKGDEIRWKVV